MTSSRCTGIRERDGKPSFALPSDAVSLHRHWPTSLPAYWQNSRFSRILLRAVKDCTLDRRWKEVLYIADNHRAKNIIPSRGALTRWMPRPSEKTQSVNLSLFLLYPTKPRRPLGVCRLSASVYKTRRPSQTTDPHWTDKLWLWFSVLSSITGKSKA